MRPGSRRTPRAEFHPCRRHAACRRAGRALRRQGDQSRQLAGARRLYVQVRAQARAFGNRRGDRSAGRAAKRPRASGRRSARTMSRRPISASSRRPASTPCGCRCTGGCSSTPGAAEDGSADTFEGQGWALLDRLVGWCRDAGLRVIVDLHAAPGGQTGVNHDDGAGFPLTFYVPRYRRAHGRAVEGDRRALSRRAGGARLRSSERADLALQRRGLSQSAARAALPRDRRRHPQRRCHITSCCSPADSGARALRCSTGRSTPTRSTPITNSGPTPTRDALQSYLNFSKRWNVPILIGETGEMNNQWNARFRELHERFGIGWVFWPYKSLDTETAVVSIVKPAGWDLVARGRLADTIDPADAAAARGGAEDPRCLSGSGEIPERARQWRLSQIARPCGAVSFCAHPICSLPSPLRGEDAARTK